MEEDKIYYRRNLPHYQPYYATYFITFRLAGSLPSEVIIKLKEEYEIEVHHLSSIKDLTKKRTELSKHHKRYFEKFDEFLDKYADSPKWLSNDKVAQIVVDAIKYRDGKDYELIAYCIMPNHVHLIFSVERIENEDVVRTLVRKEPISRTKVRVTASYKNYILTQIMRELKGSTARECNKILNRSGAFWQHESYDHVVRDGREMERLVSYVLNNPVKAGLVNDCKNWKWNYCKYEM